MLSLPSQPALCPPAHTAPHTPEEPKRSRARRPALPPPGKGLQPRAAPARRVRDEGTGVCSREGALLWDAGPRSGGGTQVGARSPPRSHAGPVSLSRPLARSPFCAPELRSSGGRRRRPRRSSEAACRVPAGSGRPGLTMPRGVAGGPSASRAAGLPGRAGPRLCPAPRGRRRTERTPPTAARRPLPAAQALPGARRGPRRLRGCPASCRPRGPPPARGSTGPGRAPQRRGGTFASRETVPRFAAPLCASSVLPYDLTESISLLRRNCFRKLGGDTSFAVANRKE